MGMLCKTVRAMCRVQLNNDRKETEDSMLLLGLNEQIYQLSWQTVCVDVGVRLWGGVVF